MRKQSLWTVLIVKEKSLFVVVLSEGKEQSLVICIFDFRNYLSFCLKISTIERYRVG